MSLYNPLLRIAQMAKTGEISSTLKATSEAFQKAGKAGQAAVSSVKAQAGSGSALAKLGKAAAYPAGIGAGIGVGAYAAGTGIQEGFGFKDTQDAVKKSSGMVLFAVMLLVVGFVVLQVMKARKG